jgi:MerR family redox-sensitive transcriptional activator SoxR
MTIGEVARRAGLNASAIRWYEAAGLLPTPRRVSGQRRYEESVLDLLALIRFTREAGFSIEEIRLLCAAGSRGKPFSASLQKFATGKIAEMDALIQRATQIRALLKKTLACQCLDIEECGSKMRRASGPM